VVNIADVVVVCDAMIIQYYGAIGNYSIVCCNIVNVGLSSNKRLTVW